MIDAWQIPSSQHVRIVVCRCSKPDENLCVKIQKAVDHLFQSCSGTENAQNLECLPGYLE